MSDNSKKSFSLRAFASVFAGISFILMVITGLVLFIAPSCRVARYTSWTVWGHNKDQWSAVHIWLSIAFVIASVIHVYLNWTVLINYFRSKVRTGWALRAEWLSALVVCIFLYAGSVAEVAPFSTLMTWKETFKHGSAESGQGRRAGRMEYQNAQNQTIDSEQSHARNEQISIDSHEDCEQTGQDGHGPGRAGGGMGRKTLRQFCSDEGIELTWAISQLKSRGLAVRDTMTMRHIADALGVHPRELRGILQPVQ